MRSKAFLLITCMLFLSPFFEVQAQSVTTPGNSVGAADDDAAPSEGKKNLKTQHPDDGSDLGKVTAESLKDKKIYWMCRNQGVVRTLNIQSTAEGCETNYSKEGLEKAVSSGQNYGSCVTVFANIRRNLEVAGWKCRDISQSRVSTGL